MFTLTEKRPISGKSKPFIIPGSPGRTRTADQVVNSHPLYRLSYRGLGLFFGRDHMVNSDCAGTLTLGLYCNPVKMGLNYTYLYMQKI
jgi:hypothetical protein